METTPETSKMNAKVRNNALAELNTLAQYYKFFYNENLNKLSSWQRDSLNRNLAKTPEVIRGQEMEFDNARKFIQLVAREAEAECDRKQPKTKVA